MYTYNVRVPFSSVDINNEITIPAIMDLFQDIAIFHSTDLGVSAELLKEKNLAWVVVGWQVEIIRRPRAYETITVGTAPTTFKSIIAERNCYIKDAEGNFLVKANSFWCLMNFSTRGLEKIPEELMAKYTTAAKIDMNYQPRNLPLPKEEGIGCKEIIVDESMIDFMGHVNNVNYIRIALRNMKELEVVNKFRVEYKNQALLDDVICPIKWDLSDRIMVSLKSKEGNVYATVSVEK